VNPDAPAESITAASVVAIRPEVSSVDVEGEVVLYDDDARVLHRLNPSASVVWACLDGFASLAEIGADVADIYQADPVRVLADVVAAARQFGAAGLLVGVRRDGDPIDDEAGTAGDAAGAGAAGEAGGAGAAGDAGEAGDEAADGPFIAEPPNT
jgi:hypothetical protein